MVNKDRTSAFILLDIGTSKVKILLPGVVCQKDYESGKIYLKQIKLLQFVLKLKIKTVLCCNPN